ncbi:MAG: DUF2461 domain-containing protein [Alphaproteobacteria bacterium]|nr:DUF2461 domain-containing protein [Alphaproteobacteria bacterium]
MAFQGLPKDFFAFFKELKQNNDRAWFEDNKQRFRDSVQAPLSAFIEDMRAPLAKISKQFVADPRPNGGSMFRIYRDVRFSKDKRPYKEHAGVQFRHAMAKDIHAPSFYMHFGDGEVFYGGGMYMPDPPALGKIRDAIVKSPAKWKAIKADKAFVKMFGPLGTDHTLAKAPRGYDPEHPLIGDIKLKSFFAIHDANAKEAQSPKFPNDVAAAFKAATPLMKFLCASQGAPL